MTLRSFLSTVPMAAVALALPAKAEPIQVIRIVHARQEAGGDYRGWWSTVDWEKGEAIFTSVERRSDGGWSNSEMKLHSGLPGDFTRMVWRYREAHSRWTALGGLHPMFLNKLALAT